MVLTSRLPGSLLHRPSFAFVGRARELEVLRSLLPLAIGESRRVALIAGGPGSGKSRLVRELADEQAGEGVRVLYGSCDPAVRVPYRPVVEALQDLFRAGPGGGSLSLPESAVELARLIPGLGDPAVEPGAHASADPDTERHRLHIAIADVLAAASERQPTLLVLEDLHWADRPTLLLLRHLLRSGSEARLLLLATYRDVDADIPGELTETLVEAWRSEGVTPLRLDGLSAEEIGEFVTRNAGAEPAAALVDALAELSGGNPFLLTQLWRELAEGEALDLASGHLRLTRPADSLDTPETIRAVVGQRLERLGTETTGMLEIAAVAGTEFELATLRAAAGLEEGELLDAVDEAERSGFIREVPARGLAYRFSHELVRRSLIERLSATRRAELHLRIAEILASGDPETKRSERLTALAHHYAAAAPVGGAQAAVTYNLLAARSASEALAFDEAAAHLSTALGVGIADRAQRAEAQLDLGYASHRAGDAPGALNAFSRTAELARELGDAELLARAAIGFEETCWRPGIQDVGSVELLEEAVAALEPTDSELRARLLGGLARALDLRGASFDAARARDESIAMARRRGDRRSLGLTLAGAYWSRGPSTPQEINDMLTEALRIGEELGDGGLRTEALGWLVPSYVSLGDFDRAHLELARLFDATGAQKQPFHLHVAEQYASALALCDGDLKAAESAAARSFQWNQLLTGGDASGTHGIQMFSLRREQGRLAELAPVVRVLAGSRSAAWRPGFVALLAELEMTGEAQRELTRAVFEELDLYRRSLWLAALAYLTDASVVLEDTSAAERLYPELAHHQGSILVIGHLVACYGATDRYLGMLATLLGEWELAEEHFEAALALNRQLKARTWLAHTTHSYGRMLLARGRSADRERAKGLLAESLALAQAIGLAPLVQAARSLGAPAKPRGGDDSLTAREIEILALIAQGRSNRDIGGALFISEHTAANHVRNILRKTGCANRTEAAAYALRRGVVGA